jgi:hypothetical protein
MGYSMPRETDHVRFGGRLPCERLSRFSVGDADKETLRYMLTC